MNGNEFVGLPYSPGSETSKETAESMIEPAKTQREKIWNYVRARGLAGATFPELAETREVNYYSSTRFTELRNLGRIAKNGKTRDTKAGRPAAVHVAIDPINWTDTRPGWPTPEGKSKTSILRANLAIAVEALEIIVAKGISDFDLYTAGNMENTARLALDELE